MTNELKPCPFCGAKAKFKGGRLSQDSVTIWGENLHRSGGFTTKEAAAADWNTSAVPDVPELVRWKHCEYPNQHKIMEHKDGDYVLHSQAAEIIAAKDAEIEEQKRLTKRAEDFLYEVSRKLGNAEAKLAQYEAQEPVGSRSYSNGVLWYSQGKSDGTIPLYASPAPAADLKAEKNKLREVVENTACPRPCNGRTDNTTVKQCISYGECACFYYAALRVEARNDKEAES